ncbi:unnamed protein product [Nyctereutes procyonoides]|uniref:(raccoon dog) hypothetical protein n=1 Tax=Nyctereutes procyonoides TaxID=34880 RepID=A0A811YWK0_NYCPR|nr:unnamed protein product [Nyctereutes procyonoides]
MKFSIALGQRCRDLVKLSTHTPRLMPTVGAFPGWRRTGWKPSGERERMNMTHCYHGGRDGIEVATSQKNKTTTSHWKRQRTDYPLKPPEGKLPCQYLYFRLLAFRNKRE